MVRGPMSTRETKMKKEKKKRWIDGNHKGIEVR